MSVSDLSTIGDWFWKKKLGEGSFGVVTLWENRVTKEQIAIKKCILMNLSHEDMMKLRERWNREVEMIKNVIKNENIISAININSSEFLNELNKTNTSDLPLLIMEYCNGGDLRQQLLYNFYGLPESAILNILKSLKNAISCLHELGITHRDIKPENIVIQIKGNQKIYKLTDLGYAKDIQGSVEASRVGTDGYFAPELILEKKYSNSVDYWSMGVIIFETICGCRPFLPYLRIAQGFSSICKKKSDHIAITEDLNGEFIYHNKLFEHNRINNILKFYIEDWLKIALEFNPKKREIIDENKLEQEKIKEITETKTDTGSPVKKNNPSDQLNRKIFTKIDKILSLNILTIFCLNSYKFLSYEITNDMNLIELIDKITKDTKIDKQKLFIILPIEQTIEKITDDTKPIDLILHNYDDDNDIILSSYNNDISSGSLYSSLLYHSPMLYVTEVRSNGYLNYENIQINIPDIITKNLNSKRFNIRPYHILEFCRNALYFIEKENFLYLTFIKGLKNYAIYLNDSIIKFNDTIRKMSIKINHIIGSMNLQKVIFNFHKNTLEEKNMAETHKDKIQNWTEEHNKICHEITTLNDDISSKVMKRYESILNKSNKIKDDNLFKENDQYDFSKRKENHKNYFEVNKIRILYEKLKQGKQLCNTEILMKYHKEICNLIQECITQRKNLLKNHNLKSIQDNLSAINKQFKLIRSITMESLQQLEKYNLHMNTFYVKKFNDIWEIIESHIKNEYENKIKEINMMNSIKNSSMPSFLNGDCCLNSIENMNSLMESLKNFEDESNDTKSLIEENKQIRKDFNSKLFD